MPCGRNEDGQATVEFLVVALALLSICVGLAALAGKVSDGVLSEEAGRKAPYSIESDAFVYTFLF